MSPKGRHLSELPLPLPRSDATHIARDHARSGTRISSDTITARWKGEALDLDHAVTAPFCLVPGTSGEPEGTGP